MPSVPQFPFVESHAMRSTRSLYVQDEDLALRAPADFPLLCPGSQRLAAGSDGAFSASDRWTLRSATIDFAAQGVRPGQVVQLVPATGGSPTLLAVAGLSGAAVVLRRLGAEPGVGQPPGPPAGALGIEFLIGTLEPQLAIACEEIDRRLRRGGSDGAFLARELVLLTVLIRQYRALSHATSDPQDPFAARALALQTERDERLTLWLVQQAGPEARPRRTRLER